MNWLEDTTSEFTRYDATSTRTGIKWSLARDAKGRWRAWANGKPFRGVLPAYRGKRTEKTAGPQLGWRQLDTAKHQVVVFDEMLGA